MLKAKSRKKLFKLPPLYHLPFPLPAKKLTKFQNTKQLYMVKKVKIDDQIDITKTPTMKNVKYIDVNLVMDQIGFQANLQHTTYTAGLCISRRCNASKDGRSHRTRPGHESFFRWVERYQSKIVFSVLF